MIDTLPDKGEKLRETNEIINGLLTDGRTATSFDEITVSNTTDLQDCPLTKKLEEMSVLTPRQGARKRSVDHANQQAFNPYASPGLLTKPRRNHGSCPSIFYHHHQRQPATANVMCDKVNINAACCHRIHRLYYSQKLGCLLCMNPCRYKPNKDHLS